MGLNANYAAIPKAGGVLLNATADTSLTAPTNTATIYTAGASGSKIEQIRLTQVITTSAAGIVNIFLHDGSTYHLLDWFSYVVTTLSTTAQVTPKDFYYANLVMQTAWTLRVSNTVAGGTGSTAATHKALAFAGDF